MEPCLIWGGKAIPPVSNTSSWQDSTVHSFVLLGLHYGPCLTDPELFLFQIIDFLKASIHCVTQFHKVFNCMYLGSTRKCHCSLQP